MGNVQDQGAVQDAMQVDEVQETAPEVSAEDLYETLTAPETEPEQETEPETEAQEEELSPEEAQKQAVVRDIQTLMEDGLTGDDLNAIARDKQVREDVQAGKTFRQAVMAYLRRQNTAAAPKNAKRGVPTATRPATAPAHEHSAIEDMSDEEFARFSEKAVRLAREGKRVTIR